MSASERNIFTDEYIEQLVRKQADRWNLWRRTTDLLLDGKKVGFFSIELNEHRTALLVTLRTPCGSPLLTHAAPFHLFQTAVLLHEREEDDEEARIERPDADDLARAEELRAHARSQYRLADSAVEREDHEAADRYTAEAAALEAEASLLEEYEGGIL